MMQRILETFPYLLWRTHPNMRDFQLQKTFQVAARQLQNFLPLKLSLQEKRNSSHSFGKIYRLKACWMCVDQQNHAKIEQNKTEQKSFKLRDHIYNIKSIIQKNYNQNYPTEESIDKTLLKIWSENNKTIIFWNLWGGPSI